MATVKTPDEIELLKAQWLRDPCWDIEDTEGFEAHRDELAAFQKVSEEAWALRRQRLVESAAVAYGIPGNLKLAAEITHLHDRIRDFEQRVSALEGD